MFTTIILCVHALGKEQILENPYEVRKVVLPMRVDNGIRLRFCKKPAIDRPTADLTDVSQVVLPYSYFPEAQVRPSVFLYDTVRRGTPLSSSEEDSQAVVLSSVTGVISGEREVLHPLYGALTCATVDRVPTEPEPFVPVPRSGDISMEEICDAAEAAHIIDELDGVPLVLKLREWLASGCDYLVADGVQIQPYESSAWAVLRDYAEQVVEGLSLTARACGTTRYHIAVCLSGQRRRSLAMRVGRRHLYQTDSYYPASEPIRRSVRPHSRTVSPDARVCRVGVQACLALYRAVYFHQSHDRCVVTVSGDAVRYPQNVVVPFGTTVQEVLTRCGLSEDPTYLILGEVMTGTAAATQDIPILPGMTCILAFTASAIRPMAPRTCIGCGQCIEVCHAGLLPFEIVRRFRNMHYERLGSLDAASCDGCGACSYVCPCNIDLATIIADARGVDSAIMLELEEDTDA